MPTEFARDEAGRVSDRSDASSDSCQLMVLRDAAPEVTLGARPTPSYLIRSSVKALRHPRVLVREGARILRAIRSNRQMERAVVAAPSGTATPSAAGRLLPLGLQAGEWVRVKPAEAIQATLDTEGRYDRLGYLPNVMDRFCGRTLRVRTRVEQFFDERNWTMRKPRDVVLLDGTFCEPRPDDPVSWAGCQRGCFLFWKEAWLERADGEDR